MSKQFTEDKSFITADNVADPLSTGSLNDLLRNKLNQLATTPSTVADKISADKKSADAENTKIQQAVMSAQATSSLSASILSAVDEILAEGIPDPLSLDTSQETSLETSLETKLGLLFEQLYEVYQQAKIPVSLRKRQFVSAHGLVISPDFCVTTQKDTIRVRAFIRAADQAIGKLSTVYNSCLHIVYPACGPFAPLLLPLIAYYKETGRFDENNLRITLIDIQPGAVTSLAAVTHEMGIAGYINEILCQDACDYQTNSPVHLVVLEAMQHGFSKEGHLPMARHFASLIAENGIMLPEEVTLRAVLATGQQEFIEQWQDNNNRVSETGMLAANSKSRVELGDILRLNLKSLKALEDQVLDEHTRLIECGEVSIPPLAQSDESSMDKPMLLICTRIKIYHQEFLGEYDSGITHPLPDMNVCINFAPREVKPGDLLVNSGDKLKFFYRLNGLPGFLATVSA